MSKKLSLKSRQELLAQMADRYGQVKGREKIQILDQLVAATGYGRKHAINVLNHPPASEGHSKQRLRRYDERVEQALVSLWKVANEICAKRLVPFLPELVSSMERHGHLSLPTDVRKRLLTISAATADRLLARERRQTQRGLSTTRPGSLIKKQIRVRTFADWDDLQLGFLEADLVAHCGETTEGCFLHTLVLVDVSTGWTECLALLRRSEADVIGALHSVRRRLPFALLGLDTDNGSEFINYEMLRYCQREHITFTRSRVHRRNDQAYVEEKNGSVVRRLIGYDRYEGVEAWRALMQLYEVLRLYLNFFQPSMKLLSKKRDGARVSKRYDRAQTPCQRLLASTTGGKRDKEQLRRLFRDLDPLALLKELEHRQDQFWQYANSPAQRVADSAISRPWTIPPSKAEQRVGVSPDTLVHEDQSVKREGPRRYRRTKKPRAPRTWRTRKDPFAEVWKELRLRLEINPAQTAKALFQDLQRRYPGRFPDGQVRTLQRRVRDWRRKQLYSAEMDRLEPPVAEMSQLSLGVMEPALVGGG